MSRSSASSWQHEVLSSVQLSPNAKYHSVIYADIPRAAEYPECPIFQPTLNARSLWQVAALIAEHMLTEVDAHQLASDAAAAQVWRGAEDGRLLRILVRLTSILERPNSEGDLQWAETGQHAACSHAQENVSTPQRSDGIPSISLGSRNLHGDWCLADIAR